MWEIELPGGTTGAPMTYVVDGSRYIVVAIGWDNIRPSGWLWLSPRLG